MGRPKGLLPVGGATLVEAHVQALRRRAVRVVVVLGREWKAHHLVLPDEAHRVINPRWETTWPADSLRLALLEADVRGPCWVTPVDTPPAALDTLDALLTAGAPAVPVDREGRDGHPVLLDEGVVAELRAAAPEGGLRTLLGGAARVEVADPHVALDFDTPEQWDRYLARLTGPGGKLGGPGSAR